MKQQLFLFCLAGLTLLASISAAGRAQDSDQAAADSRKIGVLMRLTNIDVNEKPKLKEVVVRFLKTVESDEDYLTYAGRFQIGETHPRLWKIAGTSKSTDHRVKASGLLIGQLSGEVIRNQILGSKQPVEIIEAMSLAASPKVQEILRPLVTIDTLDTQARNSVVSGLGKQIAGQNFLLELATSGKLPEDCKFTAANVLLSSTDESIRKTAGKIMKLPATAGSKPLSPLNVLVKKKGDVQNGMQVFMKKGTCANCHKVAGQGKEVGPDLSEIGSKLSRQAMFESILNPSLAVSHNYETYLIQTFDGLSFSGILVSETDEKVVIRTSEAITREIDKEDVEGMKKSKDSLMPKDLQKNFSETDLVDMVEYLMTLTKKTS